MPQCLRCRGGHPSVSYKRVRGVAVSTKLKGKGYGWPVSRSINHGLRVNGRKPQSTHSTHVDCPNKEGSA